MSQEKASLMRCCLKWGLNDEVQLDVERTFGVEEVAGVKVLRCECLEQGSTHKVLCVVPCTW